MMEKEKAEIVGIVEKYGRVQSMMQYVNKEVLVPFYAQQPKGKATDVDEVSKEILEGIYEPKFLDASKAVLLCSRTALYHLDRFLNVPAALIVQDPNPMLAAGAIIMEIPMIDRLPQEFYDTVKDSN